MALRSRPGLPDPLARRSPWQVRFFAGVMARSVAGGFTALRLARPGVPDLPPGRAVLVYANHPGWWDPAVMIVLATRLFPDRIHTAPMDAAALRRYPFMGRIGLFPVTPNSAAGAAAFLGVGSALLARPDTILWVTAQGGFADPRARPLHLRPGISALLRGGPPVTVLPLALEYPFWTERRPEALCRFGPAIDAASLARLRPGEWDALLTLHLTDCLDALAQAAMARDGAAFRTLLSGRVGTGGVYGLWQRLSANLRGRPFDPAHAAVMVEREGKGADRTGGR
ncbi:MAG: hypothetical protein RLY86_1251 [Pseudomonadota bacterium]|jgi:1-acyl-sn-glycerol-3-phosphate acyltransferase